MAHLGEGAVDPAVVRIPYLAADQVLHKAGTLGQVCVCPVNVQHPANQRPGLIHIRHALQLYKGHALMGPHHQQPMGLTALGRKIHPLASG